MFSTKFIKAALLALVLGTASAFAEDLDFDFADRRMLGGSTGGGAGLSKKQKKKAEKMEKKCTKWADEIASLSDGAYHDESELALDPHTVLKVGGLDFIDPPICKVGKVQSPIDIRGGGTNNVPSPGTKTYTITHNNWKAVTVSAEQGTHGPKLNYPTGSDKLTTTVNVNGKSKTVNLLQWHAHAPSEHTFDGKFYDAEVHFVHQDPSNTSQYYVFGVMLKADTDVTNEAFETILQGSENLAIGAVATLTEQVNPADLLPTNRAFSYYKGSFTTPPCTEAVEWHVYNDHVSITNDQLMRYIKMSGKAKKGGEFHFFINNRVPQPLYGRTVDYYGFSDYNGFDTKTAPQTRSGAAVSGEGYASGSLDN